MPTGRNPLLGFGLLGCALAVASTMASAHPLACDANRLPHGPTIRDVLPGASGPPRHPLPSMARLDDGVTCLKGRWIKDGHSATRIEVEQHLKRVATSRLL